ncbi:MAG: DUF4332 domain-containing protein [Pseudomonadota bacterium]
MSRTDAKTPEKTLLERIIAAHSCRSMHHHIVLDALSLIDGEDGPAWKSAFLKHHPELFEGAKAPDAKFKDFRNHVLHVSEGEWGGARDAAVDWYARFVEALKAKRWSKAAYALGVLSHYYADPCQPFHTGQTEEEGAVHRAVEWSIFKSADRIKARISGTGYPSVAAGDGPAFVSEMVLAAAKTSHPHYQTFIDHYDLDAGLDDPASGLDETMFEAVSGLVAYATAGVATLISRAVAEAEVSPPKVSLTAQGYLAALGVPVRRITNKMADAADRHQVEVMYAELQKTGKVLRTLPDDDKEIRKLHARQVLRKPLKELDAQPLGDLGSKHVPATPRPEVTEVEEEAAPAAQAPVDRKAEKKAAAEAKRAAKAEAKAKAAEEKEAAAQAKIEAREKEDADKQAAAEAKVSAREKEKADRAAARAAAEAEKAAEKEAEHDARHHAALAQEEADRLAAEAEAEADIEYEEIEAEAPAQIEAEEETPDVDEVEAEVDESDDEDDGPAERGLIRAASIDAAPSIGRKTARRLSKVGLRTVGDLLDCDPEDVADRLDLHYVTPSTLVEWQDEASLMIEVPGLRVHDAQILVGAGVRTSDDLAKASARDLFIEAMTFLTTPDGERVLNDLDNLEEDEVEHWIDLAKQNAA